MGSTPLRVGWRDNMTCRHRHAFDNKKKPKTYSRRDSQMVTHSSTSRPVQCLCMAERTGCPVLTDLWSYVPLPVFRVITNLKFVAFPNKMTAKSEAERRSWCENLRISLPDGIAGTHRLSASAFVDDAATRVYGDREQQ